MGRRNPIKGRSVRTNHNKTKELKKFYRLTFKHSKDQKERHMTLAEQQRPKKQYFCDKYPNEKSFISKIKIKEVNIRK